MKNKSTLLNIRKNENFLYLGNPWRKKNSCKNSLFFKKFEESVEKFQANQSNFQHWSLKGFNSVACMQKNSKKFENYIGFFNQP